MPICIDTLNALYGLDLDEESMKKWIEEHKEDIDEIKSSEDVVLKNAGRDIYNKLFKTTLKNSGELQQPILTLQ